RDDVRRFFFEAWRKQREALPLTPLEAIAADWVAEHPEYHEDLDSLDHALAAEYPVESGRSSPFRPLAMPAPISAQLLIDRPPGSRAAHDRLAARLDSAHEAAHRIMDCLGETLWRAQRDRQPPDADAYLDCIRRKAG